MLHNSVVYIFRFFRFTEPISRFLKVYTKITNETQFTKYADILERKETLTGQACWHSVRR